MADAPRTLGVVGAGTMGSGIAQLGVLARMDTVVHDPVPEALERGGEAVHRGLAHERRLFELAMATEDRVEGMSAFMEKRRPQFKGR